MPSFSVEVNLCATAYIEADTKEDAERLAIEQFGTDKHSVMAELGKRDLELADGVKLSPAVTFYGREAPVEEWS